MGFFGIKKSKKENDTTGQYVAPRAVQDNNEETTQAVVIEAGSFTGRTKSPDINATEGNIATAATPKVNQRSSSHLSNTAPGDDGSKLFGIGLSNTNKNVGQQQQQGSGNLDESGAGSYDIEDPSMLTPNATLPTNKSQDSEQSTFTITRNGQYLTLNGFANGHLMRWKFAAEEGPAILRIPAIVLAIAMMVTTIYPIVAISNFWTFPILIIALHVVISSFLIIILEGRVLGVRNPTNARARIRGIITRYINLLRLVWGRGLLFIFAASMNMAIDYEWCMFSALPMFLIGVLAFYSGCHASYNLDQLKTSLTDESYLWVKFSQNDSDEDGMIDLNGFAELLWSLGLEFDDIYTYKAFQQIDRNGDAKISFDEFKHWWIVTQNDGQDLVPSSPVRRGRK